MTQDDRNRAEARFNKAAQAANHENSSKRERDAALKAVTDNMAKLKALRLAREASQPTPAPTRKKAAAKTSKSGTQKSDEKAKALADWLAGQRSGGHRT